MAPLLPPALISFLSMTASIVSDSIYYLRLGLIVVLYIFLFVSALWLLISLYCYTIEIIIWYILQRDSRRNHITMFEIMVPDSDLRVTLKIALAEMGIWLRRFINRLRGVTQEKQDQILEDLPLLLPPISYRTGKMKTNWIECAVCLDDFVDEELIRAFPLCNHIFHLSCIDQWLRHQFNCPLCRSPVMDV
ncbi:hypothetical protein Patl1_04631 [Pistacia atlantica]|uniref:Uncharacterized protein n=1 Tax=Pistacia atlantica TaxID=434234 RepID=A0ACC1BT90_9ROSI|nr:hypothetical protein Patl1_04631 [Pistacia atlantica]